MACGVIGCPCKSDAWGGVCMCCCVSGRRKGERHPQAKGQQPEVQPGQLPRHSFDDDATLVQMATILAVHQQNGETGWKIGQVHRPPSLRMNILQQVMFIGLQGILVLYKEDTEVVSKIKRPKLRSADVLSCEDLGELRTEMLKPIDLAAALNAISE